MSLFETIQFWKNKKEENQFLVYVFIRSDGEASTHGK